jgi:hypothetical protein
MAGFDFIWNLTINVYGYSAMHIKTLFPARIGTTGTVALSVFYVFFVAFVIAVLRLFAKIIGTFFGFCD